ncbi:MAG TPA: polysaccharide deacetylase family protein, partial [Chloroflexia bacterium]|nr:polysaccharide deacetylase family protein [Chloroflexia bacterium]
MLMLTRSHLARLGLVVLGLLVLALAGLPATPTLAAPSSAPRYQGQITRVAPGKHRVALTFDGDAFAGRTWDILNTLHEYRARATFFFTGHYLETYPTRSRGIAQAGQEIASHGYDHRDYRALTDGAIARRLAAWESTYNWVIGGKPPDFWRAPYGYSDNRVRVVA